jgi:hypothetical protein
MHGVSVSGITNQKTLHDTKDAKQGVFYKDAPSGQETPGMASLQGIGMGLSITDYCNRGLSV